MKNNCVHYSPLSSVFLYTRQEKDFEAEASKDSNEGKHRPSTLDAALTFYLSKSNIFMNKHLDCSEILLLVQNWQLPI